MEFHHLSKSNVEKKFETVIETEKAAFEFKHSSPETDAKHDLLSLGEKYEQKFMLKRYQYFPEKEIINDSFDKSHSPLSKVPSNRRPSLSGNKNEASSKKKIRRSLDSGGWKVLAEDVSTEKNVGIASLKINLSQKFQEEVKEIEVNESDTSVKQRVKCLSVLPTQESKIINSKSNRVISLSNLGVKSELDSEPFLLSVNLKKEKDCKDLSESEKTTVKEMKKHSSINRKVTNEAHATLVHLPEDTKFQEKDMKDNIITCMHPVHDLLKLSAIHSNGHVSKTTSSDLLHSRKRPCDEIVSENDLISLSSELGESETEEGRKDRWRQDSMFRGMEYLGCEHQYSEENFQNFMKKKKWFQV